MKKKIIIICVLLLLLLLVIPRKYALKDGGSVEYRAILYSLTKVHSMGSQDMVEGFFVGTEVRLLSFEIYNNVEFVGVGE